jgi:hypothetical protein
MSTAGRLGVTRRSLTVRRRPLLPPVVAIHGSLSTVSADAVDNDELLEVAVEQEELDAVTAGVITPSMLLSSWSGLRSGGFWRISGARATRFRSRLLCSGPRPDTGSNKLRRPMRLAPVNCGRSAKISLSSFDRAFAIHSVSVHHQEPG